MLFKDMHSWPNKREDILILEFLASSIADFSQSQTIRVANIQVKEIIFFTVHKIEVEKIPTNEQRWQLGPAKPDPSKSGMVGVGLGLDKKKLIRARTSILSLLAKWAEFQLLGFSFETHDSYEFNNYASNFETNSSTGPTIYCMYTELTQ